MRIAGEATLHAPADRVWEALLDPDVLVRTIPGCERLEATADHDYAMTVTAGVAAIRGSYSGSCSLHDLQPHSSLVMSAQGSGAPGTFSADVTVRFADRGDGTTSVSYDADAMVGGMVGGVGQRMLSSVSKRMAAEFFRGVDGVLTGSTPVTEPSATGPGAGERPSAAVFTAPPRPGATGPSRDFLAGVLLGAGLVALGVVLGAAGRRR